MSGDRQARIYQRLGNGMYNLTQTLTDATSWLRGVDYHPEGQELVTVGGDHQARIYQRLGNGMFNLTQTLTDAASSDSDDVLKIVLPVVVLVVTGIVFVLAYKYCSQIASYCRNFHPCCQQYLPARTN